MRGRKQLRQRQIGRARQMMLVTSIAALSGCVVTGGYEQTERTICRELRMDLPTYSKLDTALTLDAGARFLDVFDAVCGPLE